MNGLRRVTALVIVSLLAAGASLVYQRYFAVRFMKTLCGHVELGATKERTIKRFKTAGVRGGQGQNPEIFGETCGIQLCFCIIEFEHERVSKAVFRVE